MAGRGGNVGMLGRLLAAVLLVTLVFSGIPNHALAQMLDGAGASAVDTTSDVEDVSPDGAEADQELGSDSVVVIEGDEESDAAVDATDDQGDSGGEGATSEEAISASSDGESALATEVEVQEAAIALDQIPYKGAKIAQVALGYGHSAAVTNGGKLWTWGSNSQGQLGNGTTTDSPSPVRVEGLGKVVEVALGNSHSAAITEAGELWMWGSNALGELGNGTKTNSATPVKVEGLDNVSQVALGSNMSLAVTASGELYLWGFNYFTAVTQVNATEITRPTKVMDNVAMAAIYGLKLAIVTTDGALYMTGSNSNGELGDGTKTTRTSLVHVLDGVTQVALGNSHTAAIKTVGSYSQILTWGQAVYGQLGSPWIADATYNANPGALDMLVNPVQIALGGYHSAAITQSGSLWMWGRNNWDKLGNGGQLGDGTSTNHKTPFHLSDGVAQVALGYLHSAAVTTEGALYTWGHNVSGQLGDGTTTSRNTPVAVVGIEDELDVGNATAVLEDPLFVEDSVNCYEHTGGQVKPRVLSVTLDGKTLAEGFDYDVSYGANTAYGNGTVTLTGAGEYTGSKTVTFRIVPGKVENLHAPEELTDEADSGLAYANYRREAELSWNAVTGDGMCYELSFSKSNEFNEDGTETLSLIDTSLPKTEDAHPRPLERDTLYYFRVRAFVGIPNSGDCAFGPWSDTLRVRSGKQILASEMWGVRNTKELNDRIFFSVHDYREVFKNGEAVAAFLSDFENSDENKWPYAGPPKPFHDDGICYGMVTSAIAYYEFNVPPEGSYAVGVNDDNFETVRASSYGLSWLQMVRYAQIMRMTRESILEAYSHASNLEGLYKAIKECQHGEGVPVTITIATSDVTHCILPVGIRSESDSEVRIEIYDPNRGSDSPTELTLIKDANGQFVGWTFTGMFGEPTEMNGRIDDDDDSDYLTWQVQMGGSVADALNQINEYGDAECKYISDPPTLLTLENKNKGWITWTFEGIDALSGIIRKINDASQDKLVSSVACWFHDDQVDLPDVPAGTTITLARGDRLARVTTSVESDVHLELKDEESATVNVTPSAEGTSSVVIYDSDSETWYAQNTTFDMAVSPGTLLEVRDHDGVVDITGTSGVTIGKTSGVEDENIRIANPVETELQASLDPNSIYTFSGEGDEATLTDSNGNVVGKGTGTDMEKIVEHSGTVAGGFSWSLTRGGALTVSGKGKMPDFKSDCAEPEENAIKGRVDAPWMEWKDKIKTVSVGDGITRIGAYAFAGLPNLTKAKLPPSLRTIGNNAFVWCTSLEDASLPEGLATIEGNGFYGCTALKSVILPSTLASLGDYVFTESGLTSVKLPASLRTIGTNIFWLCKGLTTATFQSGTTLVGDGMFYDCPKLREVRLPNGTRTIGSSAFGKCAALSKVTIPTSVTSIGDDAFKGSSKVVIVCATDSEAMAYAKDHGIKTSATGAHKTHFWGSWKVTTAATALKKGSKCHTCRICGKKVTKDIAKLKPKAKLTASTLKMQAGQKTSKFKVYGLAKGDYVKTWKSSNTAVLKVSGKKNGTCTIRALKKAGKAKVTATLASGKRVSFTVRVQKAKVKTTAIKLGVKSSLTLKKGKRQAIGATLTPVTSQEKMTYASSNTKVATVTSKGTIVAKKAGTCKITVRSGSKSKKITVKVTG